MDAPGESPQETSTTDPSSHGTSGGPTPGNGTQAGTHPDDNRSHGVWRAQCAAVGGLVFLILGIPAAIYRSCIAHKSNGSHASSKVQTPRSQKIKAGLITEIILLVIIGIAVGVPCGIKCDHKSDSPVPSKSSGPPTGDPGGGGDDGGRGSPTKSAGGVAQPCQPNFEGKALSVNGSDVEWGVKGNTVVAQSFNRSVPEFNFYFTGAGPGNMYTIQPTNNSRIVTNTTNTLVLAVPNSQDAVPSWNISCEVCSPSGSIVSGRVASACNITVAPLVGSREICVQLPDTPLGKSLMLAPCTNQNNQNFDFWMS